MIKKISIVAIVMSALGLVMLATTRPKYFDSEIKEV